MLNVSIYICLYKTLAEINIPDTQDVFLLVVISVYLIYISDYLS
jgi:hypothetical protein